MLHSLCSTGVQRFVDLFTVLCLVWTVATGASVGNRGGHGQQSSDDEVTAVRAALRRRLPELAYSAGMLKDFTLVNGCSVTFECGVCMCVCSMCVCVCVCVCVSV